MSTPGGKDAVAASGESRTETAKADATPTAAPTRRVREVDALRGFALLGILLVNAQVMAGPYDGAAPGAAMSDKVATWLVTALVAGKFYLLFAFLFGYSFTLQVRAAECDGAGPAARHLRRTACLGVLGVAHAVLLFPGDILVTYAALGLVLFAVRHASAHTLLRAAVALSAVLGTLLLGYGLLLLAATAPTGPADTAEAARLVADRQGGAASAVAANLRQWRELLAGNVLFAPQILAAFLAGLAAGKRRMLAGQSPDGARARWLLRCALAIGLAGGILSALCAHGPLDPRWAGVGTAVGTLTAPALAAAYACGLRLLLRTRHGRRFGDLLAPAGRMALTHYLTQSLVLALVFTGYGLGRYDRMDTAPVLAGCLALYAAQLALAGRLLRRVRYGPVEWLLRTATLARRP